MGKTKGLSFLDDLKKDLKTTFNNVDQEKVENKNNIEISELLASQETIKAKDKINKTETKPVKKEIKINNNENINSLREKIGKPKKEKKVYTTIYIKSSVNEQIDTLAKQWNVSKGELIENIFLEFTK